MEGGFARFMGAVGEAEISQWDIFGQEGGENSGDSRIMKKKLYAVIRRLLTWALSVV